MNEFFYKRPATTGAMPKNRSSMKFNVILTTYEWLVRDEKRFSGLHWAAVVIDEGHRLKNENASLFKSLNNFKTEFRCVLTGTPVQNRLGELYALLKHLDKTSVERTEELFLARYFPMTEERLADLFTLLGSRLLRREKGHVEKSIPPKVEILVKVPLAKAQKEVYKLVLEGKRDLLSSKKNSAAFKRSSQNTCMELRKVCNHPWLIDDQEDRAMESLGYENGNPPYDVVMKTMLSHSSKLLFLDQLLERFRKGGERVLIFSQFVMVLNLITEYLSWRGHPFEQLTGNTHAFERQKAVDRFQDPDNKDAFIFLISTKAGGCGINLTAANKVIIYDSDWNPQNDLQAQARCHRIGQKREVEVYRILTENTYEEKMFDVASQKLGLDHVILAAAQKTKGNSSKATDAMGLTTDEIERVLKHGAYDLYKNNDDNEAELDIDAILKKSKKIIHGGESQKEAEGEEEEVQAVRGLAGFSKVTFNIDGKDQIENDPDFWSKVLPEKLCSLSLARRLNGGTLGETPEELATFISDLVQVTDEEVAALGTGAVFLQDKVQLQQQLEALITQVRDLPMFSAHTEVIKALLNKAVEPRKRVRTVRPRGGYSNFADESDDGVPAAIVKTAVFGAHHPRYLALARKSLVTANKVNRHMMLTQWNGRYLVGLSDVVRKFGYGHFGKMVEVLKAQGMVPDIDLLTPQQREGVLAAQIEQMVEYIHESNIYSIERKAVVGKKRKRKANYSDDETTESSDAGTSESEFECLEWDGHASEADEDENVDEEAELLKRPEQTTIPNTAADHRGQFCMKKVRRKYAGILQDTARHYIREYRTAEMLLHLRQNDAHFDKEALTSAPPTIHIKDSHFTNSYELHYEKHATEFTPGKLVQMTVTTPTLQKVLIIVFKVAGTLKKGARVFRSAVVSTKKLAEEGFGDTVAMVLPGGHGEYRVVAIPLENDSKAKAPKKLCEESAGVLEALKEAVFLPILSGAVENASYCKHITITNIEHLSKEAAASARKHLPASCYFRKLKERYLTPIGVNLLQSPVAESLLFATLTLSNTLLLLDPTPTEEGLLLLKTDFVGSELSYIKKAACTVFTEENMVKGKAVIPEHISAVLSKYCFVGCEVKKGSKMTRTTLVALHRLALKRLEESGISKKVIYHVTPPTSASTEPSGKASGKKTKPSSADKTKTAEDAKKKKTETTQGETFFAVLKKVSECPTVCKIKADEPYSADNAQLDWDGFLQKAFKEGDKLSADNLSDNAKPLCEALLDAFKVGTPAEKKKAANLAKSAIVAEALKCGKSKKPKTDHTDSFAKNLETSLKLHLLLGGFIEKALKENENEPSPHTLPSFRQLNKTLAAELKGKVRPKGWKAKQEYAFLSCVLKSQLDHDAVWQDKDLWDKPQILKKPYITVLIPALLKILDGTVKMITMNLNFAPAPTAPKEKPAPKESKKRKIRDDDDEDDEEDKEEPEKKSTKVATKKSVKTAAKPSVKTAAKKAAKPAAKKATTKPAAKKRKVDIEDPIDLDSEPEGKAAESKPSASKENKEGKTKAKTESQTRLTTFFKKPADATPATPPTTSAVEVATPTVKHGGDEQGRISQKEEDGTPVVQTLNTADSDATEVIETAMAVQAVNDTANTVPDTPADAMKVDAPEREVEANEPAVVMNGVAPEAMKVDANTVVQDASDAMKVDAPECEAVKEAANEPAVVTNGVAPAEAMQVDQVEKEEAPPVVKPTPKAEDVAKVEEA